MDPTGSPSSSRCAAPPESADAPEFFLCWFDGGTRDVEACIEGIALAEVFVHTRELPRAGDKLELVIQGTRRYTFLASGCVLWTTRERPAEVRSGRPGFGFAIDDAEGFARFLSISRAHRRHPRPASPPSGAEPAPR